MDVLVTGANGQLGRAVVDAARARGMTVFAASHAEMPLEDMDRVRMVIAQQRPALVVNCGAWTDVDGCEKDPERADRINGHGVAYVAEACRSIDAALVHVSTDYVFDGHASRPYRPNDPVGPRSAYGRSKLLGEQAILREPRTDHFYCVRTSWVFGEGGRNFPSAIAARARAGGPLRVVDDQIGCPTYTRDLAEVLLELPRVDARPGIWHACNDGAVSWFDFARAIVSALGLEVPVHAISTAELARPAPRPAWSVLDCSALTNLRGRPLPSWQDALDRYLQRERP
ncbi:MAG: dTDP-4-dehydrorhamnose reductase [Planctomycetota bacterium]